MNLEIAEIREARRAYQSDNVVGARNLLQSISGALGGSLIRFYRTVEAEAATRDLDEITVIGPGIWVEPHPGDETILLILDSIREIENWLGHSSREAMVTFLGAEFNTPWLEARYGYYVAKDEYDKICLPYALLADPEALTGALRHEIAHRVIREITLDRAPLWLHEGLATFLEGWRSIPWRRTWTPDELNDAFTHDRRMEGGWSRAGEAYAAAHALVSKLLDGADQGQVQELLLAFSDNSFWQNSMLLLTQSSPSDEALKQVFGISESELFESLRPE